jgi:peptidoglycan/xylan/chitin deacetylase (PgdA/CDA1 family)
LPISWDGNERQDPETPTMIAVHAEEGERAVVVEFFELFKTPWRFFRDGDQTDVLICSQADVPQNNAGLLLIYGGKPKPFDEEMGLQPRPQQPNKMLSCQGGRIPVYGNSLVFGSSAGAGLKHESSGEAAMVKFNRDGRTIVRIGYDLFQEIHHLLTRGQSEANAAIPALEIHIALLRDLIVGASIPLVEIPPVPDGSKLIACLTHDMDHIGIRNHRFDHTMFGFLYRATIGSVLDVCRGRKNWRQLGTNCLAALKLPLVHLGLAKDFWHSFDRYLAIEKGLNSTFFVIPKKNEPGMDARGNRPARRAAKYDAAGLGRPLKQLQSAGDEIAVHGIDAWRDSAAGRQEHEIISRLTGTAETGVRMHWLFFDEHSHALLEAAGFSYDSTVGYNQTVGYRAGTTQVFKPVTAKKLLELPLHLMDTALFYPGYLNTAPAQTEETVRPLIANTVRFGGVLTVNWHDRSVAPERLWDNAYVRLLGQLRSNGACFLTAARTVSWFRKRRAALFEQVGSTIKIKIPAGDDTRLPGLCARSFQPAAGGGKFFETALPDGGEISLEA